MNEQRVTGMSEAERLRELLAEHRRNDVDVPGGGRPPLFWRVRCDGRRCDFYAERDTWFGACAAHEEHLTDILLASRDARLAAVEALADEWEHVGKNDRAARRACDKLRAALRPDPSEESA